MKHLHTVLSSCNMPWIGLACTEDGRPAGGIMLVIGATFLVFSLSFSSFVTDLNSRWRSARVIIMFARRFTLNRRNKIANYDGTRVKVRTRCVLLQIPLRECCSHFSREWWTIFTITRWINITNVKNMCIKSMAVFFVIIDTNFLSYFNAIVRDSYPCQKVLK